MSETKDTKPESAQPISQEQAAQVGGGEGECTTTLNAGFITTTGSSVESTVTSTYEGLVDATSHIIERVVNATK